MTLGTANFMKGEERQDTDCVNVNRVRLPSEHIHNLAATEITSTVEAGGKPGATHDSCDKFSRPLRALH